MKKSYIKYIVGGAAVTLGLICIGIAASIGGPEILSNGIYIGIGSGSVLFSGEDGTHTVETTDIKNLSVNIDTADIYFRTGDVDKITVNTSNLKANSFSCEASGDTLNVKYNVNSWFFNFGIPTGSSVEIIFPEGFEFETVRINHGVGEAEIRNIKAKTISIDSGVGETTIDSITADSISCKSGVGQSTVTNTSVSSLNIESGVGAFTFDGVLNGNGTVKSGIGEVRLNLSGNTDKYGFDVNSGIGEVTVNGGSVNGKSTGEYMLNINSGIGAVTVSIK